jgi:hypothetical protein
MQPTPLHKLHKHANKQFCLWFPTKPAYNLHCTVTTYCNWSPLGFQHLKLHFAQLMCYGHWGATHVNSCTGSPRPSYTLCSWYCVQKLKCKKVSNRLVCCKSGSVPTAQKVHNNPHLQKTKQLYQQLWCIHALIQLTVTVNISSTRANNL